MEISDSDRRILRIIQRNARLSKSEVAEAAHTSTSSCWRKWQALEERGVIERYEARLNSEKLGLSFAAIAMVRLRRHEASEVESFTAAVKARPEVLQVMAITGEADFLLRVVARDMADYNRFLNGFLFRQACVVNVSTSVVMETVKDSTMLPV